MWGAIISGVTSLASSYMDNRKIKTEHKAKVEQARVNAEINRIEKAAQSDQNYDLEALRQRRGEVQKAVDYQNKLQNTC